MFWWAITGSWGPLVYMFRSPVLLIQGVKWMWRSFLAHLAVRPCDLLPSLGVHQLSSIHFSHLANEQNLCRKHLWKVLYKDSSFYPNPLTSVAILVSGWSISKKSSPLKPISKMNRSLIGSFYERSSIKIAHFVLICLQTWPP